MKDIHKPLVKQLIAEGFFTDFIDEIKGDYLKRIANTKPKEIEEREMLYCGIYSLENIKNRINNSEV